MKKQAFILSLLIASIITVITTIGFYHLETLENEKRLEDYMSHEKVVIDAAVKNINTKLLSNMADLSFIKGTYLRSLEKNKPTHDLMSVWLLFSENQEIYHKIRYIDISGTEVFRVDHDESGTYVVENLQTKDTRPFFYESIDLDEDDYYISEFDLNVENGFVRFPIIPTIRLSQTVYVNDLLKGLIVLNYDAHILIDTFISDMLISEADDFYLINDDGDYLLNSANRNLDWDFMFNNPINFKTEYSKVFSNVEENESGFLIEDNKAYYYTHVLHFNNLNTENSSIQINQLHPSEDWVVISEIDLSHIPYTSYANYFDFFFDASRNTYVLSFFTFLAVSLLSYFYFLNRINTEVLVKYDAMTGAYTRLHGLKIAEERYQMMLANKHSVTMIFGDLNGLKEINDTYGHQVGDEAIRKFAKAIIQNIRFKERTYLHEYILHRLSSKFRKYFNYREDDIFIRLGGDEFLYMCFDVNDEERQAISARVLNEIEKQNVEGYELSASAGALVITSDMDLDFKTALNMADHAMYDDKMRYYKKVNKETL